MSPYIYILKTRGCSFFPNNDACVHAPITLPTACRVHRLRIRSGMWRSKKCKRTERRRWALDARAGYAIVDALVRARLHPAQDATDRQRTLRIEGIGALPARAHARAVRLTCHPRAGLWWLFS